MDWDATGRRFASAGIDGVIEIWPAESRPSPLVIDTELQGTLDLTWDNESSSLLLSSGNAGEDRRLGGPCGKKARRDSAAQGSNGRLVSFRHVMQRLGIFRGRTSCREHFGCARQRRARQRCVPHRS